jgi:hypothetical protein
MDKIVLLRLADFADPAGGNVWPSVGRVCRECGVSDRHVQTVIKRYLGQGLLVLVQMGGGRNRTSEYRFDLGALRALAETPNATTETPNDVPGLDHETPNRMRGFGEENPEPYAGFQNKTPNATTETPNATTLNPEPRSGEPSLTTKEHAADEGACATGADPAITHAVRNRTAPLPHGDRHAPDHPRSARRRPYDPDESRRRTLEAFPDLVDRPL